MVEERVLAQEAQRLSIHISDEMVEKELERVTTEFHGSRDAFQKLLTEEGVTLADLRNNIRTMLTTQALLQATRTTDNREVPPEVDFDTWLVQAKKSAKIIIYEPSPSTARFSFGSGSCCGRGGSSGGCGSKSSGALDEQTEKKASATALEAYKKINGDVKGLIATVKDYGCHTQVDIIKDGKVLHSYNYSGGQVLDI